MTATMARRGPDGYGLWTDGWGAFGDRRRKIIDLSDDGRQPMIDEQLGLVAVFNGCIYNYRELRRELAEHYTFTSSCDTEVLLKAYHRWGEDFVHHLAGMFAVAIVDVNQHRVVLARDRLGIKPLYLSEDGRRLRFASTLPALLAAGEVDTTLDRVALHHYLSWHSIVPAPRTVLNGVEKLPPATIWVIEADGRRSTHQYWQPAYARDTDDAHMQPRDWMEAITDSLRIAVQRRLVADVPVGVLLSGGLDSSLIVALIAQVSETEVDTFSIGFSDAGGETGNEFVYSDLVASRFGTRHHRLEIPSLEVADAVPETIAAMPEPMASHDVPAFYLLAKAVAEHVNVVQCGQGADEVFGGYNYHQPILGVPRDQALEEFTDAFYDRSDSEVAQVLDPAYRCPTDPSTRLLARHLEASGAETGLDAVLQLDTHLLMADDPVKRVDSMTMAWGVEARVPFLDQDLVALAARCPPELKASDGGKAILKAIARRMLPAEVIDRPKGYFPVPQLRHLDEPIVTMIRDVLYSPQAKERQLFRTDYIDQLLAEPNGRRTRVNGNMHWGLAVLEMWLQEHRIR